MAGGPTANELLGYPADARLLIVNADDFGMSSAVNAGILRAMTTGIVASTSLMAPCPWFEQAVQILHDHPELDFGVHLTLVSEHAHYRWGPRAPKGAVGTLLDATGRFFPNNEARDLIAAADIAEVEREYRAQIDAVLAAGLKPSHLDWHCLYDGGREDVFALTVRLAREYGLAMRVHDPAHAAAVLAQGLPVPDQGVLDSYSLPLEGKAEALSSLLANLPAGLSEWAMHPSAGGPEAEAMEPEQWRVRVTDSAFVDSADARAITERAGVVLLGYRELQTAWAAA